MTVDRLRREIAALQGRPTPSNKRPYLERRLADLRTLEKNGQLVRRSAEHSSVTSFSLPASCELVIDRIVKEHPFKNRSAFARLAFAEWCKRNGYTEEAADFGTGAEEDES